MKRKDAREFIIEIREVCFRYGVVMRGTCGSEGILGEIEVEDRKGMTDEQLTEREYFNFQFEGEGCYS